MSAPTNVSFTVDDSAIPFALQFRVDHGRGFLLFDLHGRTYRADTRDVIAAITAATTRARNDFLSGQPDAA